jgi:disulfide bond formation protein DsbB
MTTSSLLRVLDRVGARRLYIAVAVASLVLIGAALFMQHVVGLNPCPLCILQRIAYLFLAIASGFAAWRSPHSSTRSFAAAALLLALSGAAIAAWHVRIRSLPELQSCGPGLGAMLENFPLTQVLPRILRGSGDCADAAAVLFGVSLPAWSLAGFLVLALVVLAAIARR